MSFYFASKLDAEYHILWFVAKYYIPAVHDYFQTILPVIKRTVHKSKNMEIQKPTEAELAILRALWLHQPCGVKEIHAEVEKTREVGYTTTLKNVQRMLDKGLLNREPGAGKGYLYRAAESPATTKGKLFDRMVKNVFGDSVNDVVLHALGKTKASPAEIAEIKAIIEKLDQKDQ